MFAPAADGQAGALARGVERALGTQHQFVQPREAGVAALRPGEPGLSGLDELVLRADCALDAARRRPGLGVGCWSEDAAAAAAI